MSTGVPSTARTPSPRGHHPRPAALRTPAQPPGPANHVSSSSSTRRLPHPQVRQGTRGAYRLARTAPVRVGPLVWTQDSAPWLTTARAHSSCWRAPAPARRPPSSSPWRPGSHTAATRNGSWCSRSAARRPWNCATAWRCASEPPAPPGHHLPLVLLRPGPRPPGQRPVRGTAAAAVRTRTGRRGARAARGPARPGAARPRARPLARRTARLPDHTRLRRRGPSRPGAQPRTRTGP